MLKKWQNMKKSMNKTFGQKLAPVLRDLEKTIFEYQVHTDGELPPKYPEIALYHAMEIFAHVLMDKIWDLIKKKEIELPDACKMAEACGNDIRKLIKTYTGIDMPELITKIMKT